MCVLEERPSGNLCSNGYLIHACWAAVLSNLAAHLKQPRTSFDSLRPDVAANSMATTSIQSAMKCSTMRAQVAVPQITREPAWYCVRSRPKHEHIAAVHLRRLDGVTVFCPRIRFKRTTRRGLVWFVEAMFPGYLFAQFELGKMHLQVRYAHGVTSIVRLGDRYPTIEDEALTQLRDTTGVTEVKELNYVISQGDQVKLVDGVFYGLEAVVTQVLPAKERVKVLMDFLGRRIEAEVERSSVLVQVTHPLAA
jgi:transcriptional antiterminator RfaH